MKKILINTAYGGFGFSSDLLKELGIIGSAYSVEVCNFNEDLKNRTNVDVINAVERMGLKEASGQSCKLLITEVNDNSIYRIKEHDGRETLEYVGDLIGSNLID